MKPGPKIGPGFETAQLAVRLEERVLHDVFGVRGAPGQPIRHVEDVARVALDERTKRFAVAAAGFSDGRAVALVHPESLTDFSRSGWVSRPAERGRKYCQPPLMYAGDPMPTGPYRRLAAIVLNFRTPDDTVMAVRSLLASTRPPDDLIVVDNDAGPGCRAQVAGLHPAVRYVAAGSNLGFSGGMNLGIRAALAAGANAVLLVNSDATVAADCVGRLESGLDGVQVGIAGPVIHDPSIERVTSSGIDYDASTGRMRERQESLIGGAVNVDAVSGCVMLTASEVFEKVGFLDDDYFFTFEDIDFCLRARVAGFRTVVIPEAVAYHVGSRTIGKASPERLYFAARNHLLLASRATRSSNPLKSMLRTSSIVSLNLAHAVTSAHGPLAGRLSAVFRGVGDYFRGQLGHGSAAPVTISPAHIRQLAVHGEVVLPRNDDHAAILMYHRIATSPGDGSLCVAPRHFRSHLQQLRDGGTTSCRCAICLTS